MKLIGENIHVISKSVREALIKRDKDFVISMIEKQKNMNAIDLNVGPAKGELVGILPWLTELVNSNGAKTISFDTSNAEEMRKGLEVCRNPKKAFINSATDNIERLENMTDLASEFGSNLIALTLSADNGIPNTADAKMEVALDMYETCMMKGISNERIYFDPLVLPVNVAQNQSIETLNTIKILKESFEPQCNTIIGLSNVSNGSPKELRPLINKVFLTLAYGAGLDCAIVDATDIDIQNLIKMLDSSSPKTSADKLLLDLTSVTRDFVELDDIDYNKSDKNSVSIYKTAKIILNKEIYSHSFTQV